MEQEQVTVHRVGLKAFLRFLRRQPSLRVGITTMLGSNRGRITSTDELLEWIYDGDINGGPDWANAGLYTTIFHLRKAGVPIRSDGYRGYFIA